MKTLPTRLLLLLCVIGFAGAYVRLKSEVSSTEASDNGSVRGQVGARLGNTTFVPASGANVCIFYTSEYTERRFTHRPSTYTAGGQFQYALNKLTEHDKELKALLKDRNNPSDQRAISIAERMLKYTDEALATTMDWASRHPQDTWQVVMAKPDQQGYWSASGLRPGSYDVVIRGTVSRR